MPTRQVSIDRTSLGLSALVIAGAPPADYVVGASGWGEPASTPRNTTEVSPFVMGQLLVASVADLSAWSWPVFVYGTSGSDLADKIAALRAAIGQFAYTITTTFDDSGTTYNAMPGTISPDGGYRDTALQDINQALYTVTIPVNPV